MVPLSDTELLRLIDYGEADRVEFKETLSRSVANEIRETICAFANDLPDHRAPGLVVIGVRDPGRCIVGTEVSDEMLRNLADMKTDGNILPLPSIQVEKKTLRERDVAVITVLPSDSPPVRYRGRIHIRIGPRRGIATAQDERILNERRRHGDRPFDLQPIPTAGTSELNLSRFQYEYLPQAFSDDVLEANDRSLEEQLAATKMIASADNPTATVLGLLVLGKSPQDFIPCAYVDFLRIDGTELADDIVDSETIQGDISNLLRRLDDKMGSHNRTAVDITTSRTEQRTSLYPAAALQQITRNAVMHRTYEATNAPVRVNWFNDRIEVISPGGPFGAVNVDNFGEPGLTDYRNPNLADAMRTLAFVQRFGTGIPIARRLLRRAGHPEPLFTIQGNFVSVTVGAATG